MSLAHVCLCLSNDYFTTSPVSLLFTTGMNCFLRVVLWKCMRLETTRCTVNRQPEVCPKLDNGHAKIVNSSSFLRMSAITFIDGFELLWLPWNIHHFFQFLSSPSAFRSQRSISLHRWMLPSPKRIEARQGGVCYCARRSQRLLCRLLVAKQGLKAGNHAPQHVTWSSTEKDEEPRSEVRGDLLPSKSRVVGPADVLMTMPTLSKCRWKEWSATHVRPHVGTKKERWREQIGSCGAEGRASQSLSKHIKWERVETEHAPIWGTDSRLISYRIECYFILQCIFGKCLGICTPAHMMLTTCANWCTFHVSKVSLFHPLWRQGCPKIGWLVVNMDETDQLCPFWSQI